MCDVNCFKCNYLPLFVDSYHYWNGQEEGGGEESNDTEEMLSFAVMVEGGIVHYLANLASEHKKVLLRCPAAMEKDGLTWTSMVQANVGVSVWITMYVTLPPEMSRIATRSRFGYSHFPKRGCHTIHVCFSTESVHPVFSSSENTFFTHTHTQKFMCR